MSSSACGRLRFRWICGFWGVESFYWIYGLKEKKKKEEVDFFSFLLICEQFYEL